MQIWTLPTADIDDNRSNGGRFCAIVSFRNQRLTISCLVLSTKSGLNRDSLSGSSRNVTHRVNYGILHGLKTSHQFKSYRLEMLVNFPSPQVYERVYTTARKP